MTAYKTQHYLPMFYIRRFSSDGTGLFLLCVDQGTIIRRNLRAVGSEHYFYADKENAKDFETIMSAIEKSHSEILDKIDEVKGFDRLDENDWPELLRFVLLCSRRTKASKMEAESIMNTIMAAMKPDIMMSLRSQGVPISDVHSIRVQLKHADSTGILVALGEGPLLISDLAVALVRNATDIPFICGDSPVVLYNQVIPTMTALQSPGLMILFPISEEMSILFFDKELYRLKIQGNGIIRIDKTSDVDELNRLQIVNCLDYIMFSKASMTAYLKNLSSRQLRSSIEQPRTECIMRKEENGAQTYLKTTGRHSQFRAHLSFVRVDVGHARLLRLQAADLALRPLSREVLVRSPEISRAVRESEEKFIASPCSRE
ncbi:MAG: DUF4238 domain-containing protein [Methanomassiliicoccales archaeon]|nr:DUF4238 domain-containing protein [Methanomassiliicoccales archaeon]